MLTGMNPDAPISNIFTGEHYLQDKAELSVLFCRMVIIIVRKQLHKIVPESIDIIVTPTISLLVIGLATIFLIMPVAGAISNGLVGIINVVLEKVAWLLALLLV